MPAPFSRARLDQGRRSAILASTLAAASSSFFAASRRNEAVRRSVSGATSCSRYWRRRASSSSIRRPNSSNLSIAPSIVQYELLQIKNSGFSRYKGKINIGLIGQVDILVSDYATNSLLKKDLERAAVSTVRHCCSRKANKQRGSSSLRCSEWRAKTVFQQAANQELRILPTNLR